MTGTKVRVTIEVTIKALPVSLEFVVEYDELEERLAALTAFAAGIDECEDPLDRLRNS